MPRYHLSDPEVADLAAYLAGLSAASSPGVDDGVIRLATVVTDDVAPDVRDAVLDVLRTYVDDKNRQTRLESRRWEREGTPANLLPSIYRDWALEVWTLTGPGEGWREQLEKHYQRMPVFALLGGLSGASWSPVGRFCERHEIPCLFPATDLPDAGESDRYTLYFSRGLGLEADLIASHIKAHPVPAVIQVFCGPAPVQAAENLHARLEQLGIPVQDMEFRCGEPLPVADLDSRMIRMPEAAVVLWTGHDQLADIERRLPPGRLYFSSTLLDRDLGGPLPALPGPVFVAHPYRLPGEPDSALQRFTVWAQARGIEIRNQRLQSGAFFACLVMNDALTHVRRYLVRDYLLDMLDHAQGLAVYLPVHARPTLGPGQRYLTKGGYMIAVKDTLPAKADAVWILP